jgi:hypothetical protein
VNGPARLTEDGAKTQDPLNILMNFGYRKKLDVFDQLMEYLLQKKDSIDNYKNT